MYSLSFFGITYLFIRGSCTDDDRHILYRKIKRFDFILYVHVPITSTCSNNSRNRYIQVFRVGLLFSLNLYFAWPPVPLALTLICVTNRYKKPLFFSELNSSIILYDFVSFFNAVTAATAGLHFWYFILMFE